MCMAWIYAGLGLVNTFLVEQPWACCIRWLDAENFGHTAGRTFGVRGQLWYFWGSFLCKLSLTAGLPAFLSHGWWSPFSYNSYAFDMKVFRSNLFWIYLMSESILMKLFPVFWMFFFLWIWWLRHHLFCLFSFVGGMVLAFLNFFTWLDIFSSY